MALPTLSSVARRFICSQKYASMIFDGLSNRRIVDTFMKLGQSYRRTDMLHDINQTRARMQNYELQDAFSHADIMPVKYLRDVEFTNERLYRVFGEYTFYNPRTGQERIEFGSYYTDYYSSFDQMDSALMADIELARAGKEYDEIMTAFKTRFVWHNQGYPQHVRPPIHEI